MSGWAIVPLPAENYAGRRSWREKEYWIFCDESVQEGRKFSSFFGGVIVPARRYADIENRLRIKKAEIGFLKEIKWQRVSEMWLPGYVAMMSEFFAVLRDGDARMRVMFRDNRYVAQGLSEEQRAGSYFRLYYQFIKHSFGLGNLQPHRRGTRLRLFFDQFPDTRERVQQFKGYLAALPFAAEMRNAHLIIAEDHITEVDSRDHVLLQCADVVLGAMAFRLNDLHLEKPAGQRKRGNRTLAKDRLYRHILAEICKLKPSFNPKLSTGFENFPEDRWTMPYRHWAFVPRDHKFQP